MHTSDPPKGKLSNVDGPSHSTYAMIIIDTSVWISFFNRPVSKEKEEVDRLIDSEEVVMVGVVLTELVQGTRSLKEKRLIKEALLALPYFETSQSTWLLAGEISSKLLQAGVTLGIPDLVIAALAQEHSSPIYSLDSDFQKIPRIQLYNPGNS